MDGGNIIVTGRMNGRIRARGYLSGETALLFSFLPPFLIGINSLRKEFAPVGANSFL